MLANGDLELLPDNRPPLLHSGNTVLTEICAGQGHPGRGSGNAHRGANLRRSPHLSKNQATARDKGPGQQGVKAFQDTHPSLPSLCFLPSVGYCPAHNPSFPLEMSKPAPRHWDCPLQHPLCRKASPLHPRGNQFCLSCTLQLNFSRSCRLHPAQDNKGFL